MGKSDEQKQAEANNLQIQQQQLNALNQANATRQQLLSIIQPFGQAALNLGQGALNGQVPSQFILPIRNQLSANFDQSRQNLTDALGQQGQSGSGISTGPIANLEQQQSVAGANAYQQALMQALGIGFQGSNVLQGQQSIFDPNALASTGAQAGNTVIQAPGGFGSQLLGGLLGAGANAGFSWLTKPKVP